MDVRRELSLGCRFHSADEELKINCPSGGARDDSFLYKNNPWPWDSPRIGVLMHLRSHPRIEAEQKEVDAKLFSPSNLLIEPVNGCGDPTIDNLSHVDVGTDNNIMKATANYKLLSLVDGTLKTTKSMMNISTELEQHMEMEKLKSDFMDNKNPPCTFPDSSNPCTYIDVESLADGAGLMGILNTRIIDATFSDKESDCMFDKMQRPAFTYKIVPPGDGFIKHEGKMSDRRKGKLETMDEEVSEKYAYLLAASSYAVLYTFLSSNSTWKNNAKVMMGVRTWTLVLMLVLFTSYSLRRSHRVANVVRILSCGLLFVSALVIFILILV